MTTNDILQIPQVPAYDAGNLQNDLTSASAPT